jgi:glyoxylase-like metal-dependent hydrolase (beta-lactamase superfamily II)
MINIKQFVFNPFMENTYVIYDDEKNAAIIDPGCYEGYEQNELVNFIKAEGLNVIQLINTHCHIDHVLGNAFVKEKFGVDLFMHEKDLPILEAVPSYSAAYGFANYRPSRPNHFLKEGDIHKMGNIEFEVLFLPGHSPGHIGLMNETEKVFIGGDVLFDGSIGRTDLPGGDHDTLISSIQNKLFKYHDEVKVYCGHGPETTLGKEKATNPFCAIK